MLPHSLAHASDAAVLQGLRKFDAQDREVLVPLLQHLGEVDARRLYLPAAYSSMFAYCVGELRWSEDVAYKRIRVARLARRFPRIFVALSDGSLTLSAVFLLKKHLNARDAESLLSAATHKTNAQIERMLAERFPQPDVRASITPVANLGELPQLAVRPVIMSTDVRVNPEAAVGVAPMPESPERTLPVTSTAEFALQGLPGPTHPRVQPLSPSRFALRVTISERAHELLRSAQCLLGHRAPTAGIEQVLELALERLVHELEKQKYGRTEQPRSGWAEPRGRHIPSALRREVSQRDGGQCTFVAPDGRRCGERMRLEFDHVLPIAMGGVTSFSNLRLRCQPHNQYEAERILGRPLVERHRAAPQHESPPRQARRASCS